MDPIPVDELQEQQSQKKPKSPRESQQQAQSPRQSQQQAQSPRQSQQQAQSPRQSPLQVEAQSPPPTSTSASEFDVDDEPDETLKERLWGLTEMFPEPIAEGIADCTNEFAQLFTKFYRYFRTSTWMIVTSTIILLGPLYVEWSKFAYERSQMAQFGPCAGVKRSQFLKKQGCHPCQPFRPQN